MIRLLLLIVLLAGSACAATAHSTIEVTMGPDGQRLVRTLTPADGLPLEPAPPDGAPPIDGIRDVATPLWVDRNHMNAVAENVAISGNGAYGIAGWWLNNMRTALYRINDDAVPEWTRPMPAIQFQIPVDADYAAERMTSTSRNDSLYVFRSETNTPVHSHWFTPPLVGYKDAVSDAGNTYVGGGGNPDGTAGEIRAYDGGGILAFKAALPAPPEGVAVSADGLIAAANTRRFVKIWEVATGALRDSVAIPGETQVAAALSGDGARLVTGGFSRTLRLYQWNGTDYVQTWAYAIPGVTWISALAISDDGSTIGAGTWTNPTGGSVLLFDASSSTPLWVDATYGDWVSAVALTPDGRRLAAGSWGRQGGTVGTIISAYDRSSATPFATIPDDNLAGVGSCMAVDISEDGFQVFAGGKAVHAREFGSGGFTLAINLSAPGAVDDGAWDGVDGLRCVATPNPFRAGTRIRFDSVPSPEGVRLDLIAADGRRLRTIEAPAAGAYWQWDGRDDAGREAAAGVYYLRAVDAVGDPAAAHLLRLVKVR